MKYVRCAYGSWGGQRPSLEFAPEPKQEGEIANAGYLTQSRNQSVTE